MRTILLTILILACLVLMGAGCKEIATVMMGGAVITSGGLESVKDIQDAQKTPSDEPTANPAETKPSFLDYLKAINPINTYKVFMDTELKMAPKPTEPSYENQLDTSDTKDGYKIFFDNDGEKIQYSAPSQ